MGMGSDQDGQNEYAAEAFGAYERSDCMGDMMYNEIDHGPRGYLCVCSDESRLRSSCRSPPSHSETTVRGYGIP